MKKVLLLALISVFIVTSCQKEKDPFLITETSIGALTQEIQMKQIDSIFANDSIVKLNPIEGALGTQGEVEIYEKGGQKLLLISPADETDPNSKISNIQLFDSRYKTEKGLHIESTFADVKANYEIASVENAINAVVVFLKDSNMYITIDKKELPENSRYNYSSAVEASQIPDTATFKYLMMGWDVEENETE